MFSMAETDSTSDGCKPVFITRFSALVACIIVAVAVAVLVVIVEQQLRALTGHPPTREFRTVSPLPRWPR
jgi:hypothetical protein